MVSTEHDRLTKVDLSSTGNTTPLLTEGDLIYSYDGELIWEAAQLDRLAGASGARGRVRIAVLRQIKTTSNHPITGVADEYAWQSMQFKIAGGPIGAGYETQGSQPRQAPLPAPSVAEATEPGQPSRVGCGVNDSPASSEVVATNDQFIRFACPSCGKRLKCTPELAGKKTRCPKCQSPVGVPTGGR